MSICQDIINTNNALRENSSTQGQVQYDTLIAKINAQDTQMQNAKMLMISLNAKADAMLQKANDIKLKIALGIAYFIYKNCQKAMKQDK